MKIEGAVYEANVLSLDRCRSMSLLTLTLIGSLLVELGHCRSLTPGLLEKLGSDDNCDYCCEVFIVAAEA